jgi:opacity protein-like surface antigen
MKKVMLLLLVFCLATFSFAYEDKEINVFGNLGMAFSDLEGLNLEVGGEMQFSDSIFGQLSIDYYLNPMGDAAVDGVDASAYGINLYGVYKTNSSDTLNYFAKAGAHYTTVKASADVWGVNFTATDSNFGIAGGAGIEYALSEKMDLVVGGLVKVVFADETGTWFNVFAGINFQVN